MRASVALYVAVGLGAAIGGTGRWLASVTLAAPGWPWATLAVNALGSLAIGFFAALTGPGGRVRASPGCRHFVMTGICGGFTTFSVFSLETVRLAAERGPGMAGLYVGCSVAIWMAAAWAGLCAGERVSRAERA